MFSRSIVRMSFKTELALRMYDCMAEDALNKLLKIFGFKECWSSPTKMKFPYNGLSSKDVSVKLPLSKYGFAVCFFHLMIFSDPCAACAIGTQTFAKGEVNVETYTFCVICFIEHPFHGAMPFGDRKIICVPTRHGRITRVAWYGNIVLFY